MAKQGIRGSAAAISGMPVGKRNVFARVEGNKLIVEMGLDEAGEESQSGKTMVVATTGGFAQIPGSDVSLSVNLTRKA